MCDRKTLSSDPSDWDESISGAAGADTPGGIVDAGRGRDGEQHREVHRERSASLIGRADCSSRLDGVGRADTLADTSQLPTNGA
jgi:hypothetical protein